MTRDELRALRKDLIASIGAVIATLLDDSARDGECRKAEEAWRKVRNRLDELILRRALERKKKADK